MRRLALLLALPSLLLACSASKDTPECRVGADCASGACSAQGVCLPLDDAASDAPLGDDAPDTATTTDAATGDAPSSDAPATGCVPNGDFVITPQELPLGPGLKATYRTATSVTVDTTGTAQPDGTRKWDLSGALSGDKNVLLETSSPSGTWWASSYPTATYAVPLTSTSDLLGVFKLDAAALSLLGIVSPTSSSQQTNVAYATPVPMTKLPLSMGTAWTATSNVSGTYQGVPGYFYTEKYDVKVDAKGTMVTPFGTFQVLRVSTLLTKTFGASITYTRSYGFMAECFGTVALISSSAGFTDPGAEFSSAAEVRRLAP